MSFFGELQVNQKQRHHLLCKILAFLCIIILFFYAEIMLVYAKYTVFAMLSGMTMAWLWHQKNDN